ncbi:MULTISPECIES: LicD family protein [Halocynthiibacter]|uniref:LicD family protein n=1 Tax=Halocynthiibacter halioticoli TaxID=2986804 RepID=A0AAE3IZX3_9RHOB|nr:MULTISPECIES: LicD family protein [Halocynthiibacter]MCV6825412.1 LicD family protein [Halocynthiibacter halioticoli]MCW4058413.1 LicD family protein [Halocynthiibacter sp. SDUM655004]
MPKLWRPRVLPVQKRDLSQKSWASLRACDEELLNRELVDKSTVKSLRKTINKVPRAERGVDWVERVISIYAVKEAKRKRWLSLIYSIERTRIEAGEHEKFKEFKSRLTSQLSIADTEKKFNLIFELSDHASALEQLRTLFDRLHTEEYKAFVNSGTLLGAVREKDFIAHDYDADIAVLLEGNTDSELVDSFNRLFYDLHKHYGDELRPRAECKQPHVKVKTKSGLAIDVFPAWQRDGSIYIWPHTFGELKMSDILPVKECMIKGETFPAPANPEKMLALNYGAGWNTPDSKFKFPWEEAEIKFAGFLDAFCADTKKHINGTKKQWFSSLFNWKA